MDLSLWPADSGVASSSEAFDRVLASSSEQLLADDTEQVTQLLDRLRAKVGGIVDLVVDNAGFELCTDLLLADHLVGSGAAKCVRFRVKHHPTFVSDALERDVDAHIAELSRGDGAAASVARNRPESRFAVVPSCAPMWRRSNCAVPQRATVSISSGHSRLRASAVAEYSFGSFSGKMGGGSSCDASRSSAPCVDKLWTQSLLFDVSQSYARRAAA